MLPPSESDESTRLGEPSDSLESWRTTAAGTQSSESEDDSSNATSPFSYSSITRATAALAFEGLPPLRFPFPFADDLLPLELAEEVLLAL
jgi:hypothetical protein